MLARVSLFAACALLAGQASASIYTIKPTAKSTYSAGDSFTVTWTADSVSHPLYIGSITRREGGAFSAQAAKGLTEVWGDYNGRRRQE